MIGPIGQEEGFQPPFRYPHNRAQDISAAEPYRRRWRDLDEAAASWLRHWAEIEENEFPRRGRWLRGRDGKLGETVPYSETLLNNSILQARHVVAAGLKDGLTPSTQEWFKIYPEDENLRDDAEVTWYLARMQKRCLQIFNASNFYSEIYGCFDDIAAFGSSTMLMEDGPRTTMHFTRLPIGSYRWEADAQNDVIGLARVFSMTHEALYNEFGPDNLPPRILERMEQGHYYDRENIIQYYRPVDPEDHKRPDWAGYECVYFLENKGQDPKGEPDPLLGRRYYRVRPFIAFRWLADDDSPYGARCPGMDCLGDCKELQKLVSGKSYLTELEAKPPVTAPQNLAGQLRLTPGSVTYCNAAEAEQVKPLILVKPNLQPLLQDITDISQRIQDAHYNRYFLAMLGPNKEMTAVEANYREGEKTTVLGPIIERSTYDLLYSLMERTIDFIMFHELAPPLPEQLGGNVKFVFSGPLAMAQKARELMSIERVITFTANTAAATQNPAPLDRIDTDEAVEDYVRLSGVGESMLVPIDEANQIRAQRAQAQQQAAQVESVQSAAATARDMSQAKTGQGTVLDQFMPGNE